MIPGWRIDAIVGDRFPFQGLLPVESNCLYRVVWSVTDGQSGQLSESRLTTLAVRRVGQHDEYRNGFGGQPRVTRSNSSSESTEDNLAGITTAFRSSDS